jgi:hypothetical protein
MSSWKNLVPAAALKGIRAGLEHIKNVCGYGLTEARRVIANPALFLTDLPKNEELLLVVEQFFADIYAFKDPIDVLTHGQAFLLSRQAMEAWNLKWGGQLAVLLPDLRAPKQ